MKKILVTLMVLFVLVGCSKKEEVVEQTHNCRNDVKESFVPYQINVVHTGDDIASYEMLIDIKAETPEEIKAILDNPSSATYLADYASIPFTVKELSDTNVELSYILTEADNGALIQTLFKAEPTATDFKASTLMESIQTSGVTCRLAIN
ncbi:hypothetical protein G7062_06445 [Erysipelothrix sp. HDW6C]|uniref:hypothetical protein n=1 Tax=Erysipelothrix sp. HDW6C TaxID=2714930 RepID=UPI001408C460|nr:hypothetical protein [Erysipelothrix sp. HDW6C]QIK69947.1 hypothetical protein G7062_06445 [Erysipelothrix sp. HDW6C]